jgi:23S rRNA pseudouridine1911/1915/1917 synthase
MDIAPFSPLLEAETNESLFEHHRIQIDTGQKPYRIDQFLMGRLPNTSRSRLQLAIKNQLIVVNGRPTKPSYKVRPQDVIQVVLPTPPVTYEIIPENIPLDIVYEDSELLIIHKPAGMVVHPGCNNWTGTLIHGLLYYCSQLPTTDQSTIRPGLVHRIDKDTSGLLVVAKTDESLLALAKQFYDHSISRTYYALVWGEPAQEKGTIDVNLDRSLRDRRIVAPYLDPTKGKRAITHYEVVSRLRYVSLLRCKLETGRTHQIRAHMKYIGHTIFGDVLYGGNQVLKGEVFSKYKAFVQNCFEILPRQALHAYSLGFMHPTREETMYFEAPLAADFQAVLDRWTHYAHYH